MNVKQLSFLSVLSLLIFISCSDDDNKVNDVSIVGAWKFQSVVSSDVKTNSAANDTKAKEYILGDADDYFSTGIFTFGKDKSVTFVNRYFIAPFTGTYTIWDKDVTITWNTTSEIDIRKLTLENGKLLVEKNYKPYLDNLLPDELIELGLPSDLEVNTAEVIMAFQAR